MHSIPHTEAARAKMSAAPAPVRAEGGGDDWGGDGVSDLSQESPLWREWAESRHSVQQMREELDRLRAENARLIGDHAAALRLVADVRAAIGDDGKRMQPELIEYCKAMKKDAAAAPELAEALKLWARWDDMTEAELALALEATAAALAKANGGGNG